MGWVPINTVSQNDDYASRPCYGELVAILLIGALHVIIEIGFSKLVAGMYNAGVSIAVAIYLAWRLRRTPGALRVWGLRRDNFLPAVRAQLWFVAVGILALVGFAAMSGSLALPGTFWLTVALYPVWGMAQQFALQNLIARNLAQLISSPGALAMVSAVLFAISHYPRTELVVLTLVAGFFFTLLYRKCPNLWAVGIAHGLLGSVAVYLALGEDPGAAVLDFLLRH